MWGGGAPPPSCLACVTVWPHLLVVRFEFGLLHSVGNASSDGLEGTLERDLSKEVLATAYHYTDHKCIF